MDSDSPQLPFTWKQIKSRVYKEKNRQLKPLRVIVFHLERYFEIVLYIGGLEKYEDFLHFHFQAMRINRPEPDEGEIFDGIVAEGWTGMPRYFSPAQQRWFSAPLKKEPTEVWLATILSMSEKEFGSLVERQQIDFSPRLEVLNSLGRFSEGYLFHDFGLNVELLLKFETAYCKLRYQYNN